MAFVEVWVAYPSEEAANKAAKHLLEKRIAGCANIAGPVSSHYWWKGKIEGAKEWIAMFKLPAKNFARAKSAIEKVHPYDVPAIIKFNVSANDKYEKWLKGECK